MIVFDKINLVTSPTRILIADDDAVLRDMAKTWLTKAGCLVTVCRRGSEVLPLVLKERPDLVLMDVLLEKENGVEICAALKKNPAAEKIPVILISGERMEQEDVVDGLQGGADDYLLKPLNPDLLLAKIQAVLRRVKAPEELEQTLRYYNLTLNVTERRVQVEGKDVALTRKEFDLLMELLRKPKNILSPLTLLKSVWGYEPETYNDPHTVEVHVSRLKKKLGESFSSRIKTVIGFGYRLD